jgi:Rap1a immunity proteins
MKALAVAIYFASVVAANAQFYSGNELNASCKKKDIIVYAYVAGTVDKAEADQGVLTQKIIDTLDERQKGAKGADGTVAALGTALVSMKHYCIPKGVTLEQMGDVFCKYLAEKPAERQKSAADLLVSALNGAWPCAKSDGQRESP